MIHSSISLAVHIVLVFVLLKFSALGIYAVVIGNATFPILIFILNLRTLYQEIDYTMPYISVLQTRYIGTYNGRVHMAFI